MRFLPIVLAAAVFLGSNPTASAKTLTCRGELITGTLDSGVGDCSFLSKGSESRKIFKVCKMGDECEVVADVRPGDYSWIAKVISVHLIKKSQ